MTQQQQVLALFYLCYCKLNHISPDRQQTKGLNISQLYQISVYHDIGAIVCMALEAAGIEDSRRAETLSVAEFVALADAFYEGGLS